MKKRIFSGAQPTGELHIGNYLGALKNWVALQDEYEAFYCIVNLHAITLPQNPDELRRRTLDLARIYLAAGVDPEKSTIFIQSDVAEHAELTWILSSIARMGELERMTQFKDKTRRAIPADRMALIGDAVMTKAREMASRDPALVDFTYDLQYLKILLDFDTNQRAGAGLFTYPLLMAADILLYQTDLVPVGQDQKQHLELTRDLAERFNRDFGETFKIPEPFIPPVGANIKSLQNPAKKMSKSDENAAGAIFLLDDADTVVRKFKRAVTDSGTEISFDETRPAIDNLLTIYRLLTNKTAEECIEHFVGKGYGQFKTELAEVTNEFLRPFQDRVKDFDDETLAQILKDGADNARSIARATLKDAHRRIGIA